MFCIAGESDIATYPRPYMCICVPTSYCFSLGESSPAQQPYRKPNLRCQVRFAPSTPFPKMLLRDHFRRHLQVQLHSTYINLYILCTYIVQCTGTPELSQGWGGASHFNSFLFMQRHNVKNVFKIC